MTRSNLFNKILDEKIIAILRLKNPKLAFPIVEKLIESDINCIEITSNTPNYLSIISSISETYPQVIIGAGTVYNKNIASEARKAGAQFFVSPNTDPAIIDYAHTYKIPVIMGALSPSEVATCINYKADGIKVFPAGQMGPKYLKMLKGPFDKAKLFAVGGVNLENLSEWFQAGAVGVGLGGNLVNQVQAEQGDYDSILKHLKKMRKLVDSF